MPKVLVSDELWEQIEPLLPPEPPKPKGGRPRIPDRQALTGILFVLKPGIPWEYLAQEMGCGPDNGTGADYGTGTKEGCGTACIGYFWTGCGKQIA